MILYLVQHGEATSEEVNPERPLTEKGRRDVTQVTRFLKNSAVKVDHIWHSTKTRAIQTAEQIAETMEWGGICEKREGLAPNDPIEELVEKIKKLSSQKPPSSLMIVGHLPFLQKLAGFLLTGSASRALVGFRQGGVVCLEEKEGSTWQLAWSVVPDLFKD